MSAPRKPQQDGNLLLVFGHLHLCHLLLLQKAHIYFKFIFQQRKSIYGTPLGHSV